MLYPTPRAFITNVLLVHDTSGYSPVNKYIQILRGIPRPNYTIDSKVIKSYHSIKFQTFNQPTISRFAYPTYVLPILIGVS